MNMSVAKRMTLATLLSVVAFCSFAKAPASDVPRMQDARVFAEFNDEMPAVLNYFTNATEDEVIAFYKEQLGEIVNQHRKRGRLTLYFVTEQYKYRVVISQQNNKRQVDVLVENA